jgi:hypothetical protein
MNNKNQIKSIDDYSIEELQEIIENKKEQSLPNVSIGDIKKASKAIKFLDDLDHNPVELKYDDPLFKMRAYADIETHKTDRVSSQSDIIVQYYNIDAVVLAKKNSDATIKEWQKDDTNE